MVEETDEDKFLRVRGVGGGFIYQATHGAITWGNPDIDGGFNMGRRVPTTYVVSFPRILKSVELPVPGCPEIFHSADRMREHFM